MLVWNELQFHSAPAQRQMSVLTALGDVYLNDGACDERIGSAYGNPAMRFCDGLDHRKAQPAAAALSGPGIVGTPEWCEGLCLAAGGKAGAGIANTKYGPTVHGTGLDMGQSGGRVAAHIL